MQKLFFLTIFSILSIGLQAQATPKKETSDPAAKAVLEAMRLKYEAYNTLQAKFTLTYEIPEEPTISELGTLTQQGDKYRLQLEGRTLVSDGESVWLHVEKNNEVQINNAEDDDSGSISSPKDLLRAYEWEDFIYVLSDELTENGRVVQLIEFKPTNRDSDYSKIRLTIDKKTHEVIRGKAFSKDGTRLTITVDELKPNVAVTAATFTFAKSECPGCHFEDLRI